MSHSSTSPQPSRRPRAGGRAAHACASVAAAAVLTTLLATTPAEAQYTIVSRASGDGAQSNGQSGGGIISGNGRFVAFTSAATNLVADDTNGVADVFVRDLVNRTTTRVSVTSAGVQATAASSAERISDDGNIVLFASAAALVPEDTGQSCADKKCIDVYAHDRGTGQTTRVSIATDGTQANHESLAPDMSADGRYVVFLSAATNLIPNDTNAAIDIFLHDRTTHTTTRVTEGPEGQSVADSSAPAISADGGTIAFVTSAVAFAGMPPDNDLCSNIGCARAYFKTRSTGTLVRHAGGETHVTDVALTGDGSVAALFSVTSDPFFARITRTETLVLATGQRTRQTGRVESNAYGVVFSRDGRLVAELTGSAALDVIDVTTRTHQSFLLVSFPYFLPPSFDARGLRMAFSSPSSQFVVGDTNGLDDVFVYDGDPDGDGMPTTWETRFGLEPANAADGALDADGDGVTNQQEFLAGSHPKAPYTRYFAEGAANSFFDTQFDVIAPGGSAGTVVTRFLGSNGKSASRILTIDARRPFTISPLATVPDAVYSTVIESDQPIVVDRLMSWDGRGYGSHLESGVDAPATTWYLAEGAAGSGFSLFYLLQNPGDAETRVTVDYLRPSPLPVITKTYDVAAHSRFTVDVAGQDPGLSAGDVSAKLTAPAPFVVERAMYRSRPGQPFAAGHAGAGIAAPATRWFLAEGATGFFDEYVLIANAEASMAKVKVTFLLPDGGTTLTDDIDVQANSRFTVDLKRYPALAATPVSVIVESTNSVPVIVERAIWWPTGGDPYEASLSAGVTSTGTRWSVAAGRQGNGYQTYVLVANTDPTRDGQARITLHFAGGDPKETIIDVPKNGRATFDAGTLLGTPATAQSFSIIVEALDGLPIVVERSLYYNAEGVPFAAGATSVATNITPQP